ncbi:putative UDP-Gal or UDP-GlcNAc-dependent glycosyltransferase [Trypanosoma grayi]|uniref:putative UDP-Gal or UDP-GlcNAc-dependent glycosyltransferase n=1 Tax=Trypanosoma grayi TaxID=71804 RepID=UPI0004F48025|nr:putative UDP-Gal or UDP-GlcNAc-dependent glycosyltransferase [Trypanosoma grayi]KEG06115.1 putative UDP-Gal or UDP-GlcNAc-dependent glycosyltransferase [Trypanosoma grayi]
MLGRVLYETRYPHVIFVREKVCRFHDVHVGANRAPVTSQSVVVHHLREHEYAQLAHRFHGEDRDAVTPMRFERRAGPMGVVGEALYTYNC